MNSEGIDTSILVPVPRLAGRKLIGLTSSLPFAGRDLWNSYEFSWLSVSGTPEVAILQISYDCTTEHLVESKSLKLYLNTYYNVRFESLTMAVEKIRNDVGAAIRGECIVEAITPIEWGALRIAPPVAQSIDSLDAGGTFTYRDPSLLLAAQQTTEESLSTNLLRSLCPLTGQPDWATVIVSYRGPKIERASLLRYVVSLREHQGYHEHCCEMIFIDILDRCRPDQLAVLCAYTRRGGIDINPLRYTPGFEDALQYNRLPRQ